MKKSLILSFFISLLIVCLVSSPSLASVDDVEINEVDSHRTSDGNIEVVVDYTLSSDDVQNIISSSGTVELVNSNWKKEGYKKSRIISEEDAIIVNDTLNLRSSITVEEDINYTVIVDFNESDQVSFNPDPNEYSKNTTYVVTETEYGGKYKHYIILFILSIIFGSLWITGILIVRYIEYPK